MHNYSKNEHDETWVVDPFWFDGNQAWGEIRTREDWQRIVAAYAALSIDPLIARQGPHRAGLPSYGFRREHRGGRTLGEHFESGTEDYSNSAPWQLGRPKTSLDEPRTCPTCGHLAVIEALGWVAANLQARVDHLEKTAAVYDADCATWGVTTADVLAFAAEQTGDEIWLGRDSEGASSALTILDLSEALGQPPWEILRGAAALHAVAT